MFVLNKDPLKFPYDALVQLENIVFTDNWSIPYKKDEWLERLLVSTIALLKESKAFFLIEYTHNLMTTTAQYLFIIFFSIQILRYSRVRSQLQKIS